MSSFDGSEICRIAGGVYSKKVGGTRDVAKNSGVDLEVVH